MPYKKLNIKNGQILNETHLAHFEQGISNNSTNIEEIQDKIKDIEDNGGGNTPIVYPQQFGAIGDGETDDTNALNTVLSKSNCVIDGGNKKYKYRRLWMDNVKNVTVQNVIFYGGESLDVCGCRNIRFLNCRWEEIRPASDESTTLMGGSGISALSSKYTSDGTHPNAAGYERFYMESIAALLKRL